MKQLHRKYVGTIFILGTYIFSPCENNLGHILHPQTFSYYIPVERKDDVPSILVIDVQKVFLLPICIR